MQKLSPRTRRLTALAMMLAMITALSALEHMLPALPLLPPNVRLGLSNIVTMYVLFYMGTGSAFTLALLKSLFVMLMRGPAAGLLSLGGGVLSLLVILLLSALLGRRISYLMLSICGAITHNMGQIALASLLLGTGLLYYLPVLVLSGVLMGSVTGVLLRVVMPLFRGITGAGEEKQ